MFTESYVLYSAGFCESFVEKNYIYWLFDILWRIAVQSAVYSVHDKSVSVCLSCHTLVHYITRSTSLLRVVVSE